MVKMVFQHQILNSFPKIPSYVMKKVSSSVILIFQPVYDKNHDLDLFSINANKGNIHIDEPIAKFF